MTKTPFPTPAADALAEQGDNLRAQAEKYLQDRIDFYSMGTKESLISTYEERKSLGAQFVGVAPKPSESKALWVKFLANNDKAESQIWANLKRLERADDAEREVIRKATKAETWAQVKEARKADFARTLEEERYDSAEHLANLAYEYEVRFQVAARWMHVRTAMGDHEMAPAAALLAVVEDVKASIVSRAATGGFRSSSMTSNLREEAITKGLAQFLQDVKYTLNSIEA